MDLYKYFSLKNNSAWVIALRVLGAVLVLSLVLSFIGRLFGLPSFHSAGVMTSPFSGGQSGGTTMGMVAPAYPGGDLGGNNVFQAGSPASEPATYGYADTMMKPDLSTRNVDTRIAPFPPLPPTPGTVSGTDAEDYEVTDYSATIETHHLADTCSAIVDLKKKTYVIFQSSNEYDKGCFYAFKVKNDKVTEVLGDIRALDPRELSENSYTIKKQLSDYTSEQEILQNKLTSIQGTLTSALKSYDEISGLATRTQNADALAKIIDSKIGIIERLSEQRISLNEQLDRLARAKADSLDRLDYTYFNVSVLENKFIDGQGIADSWNAAIKAFVYDFNASVQALTLGVLALALTVVQWLVYAFFVLWMLKYVWKWAVLVWNK